MTSLPGWHPVAADRSLADRPIAARVVEQPIALWRNQAGLPQAVTDRCPHRGARLSLGRVVAVDGESRLECPYHGWQFGADGRCRLVPATPDFRPTDAHRVERHAVRYAHGLVWVKLAGAPADDGPFALPEPGELPPRRIVCGPYDVQTSAPRVVENFLDMAHFAFVHEGVLGERGELEVRDHSVVLDARGAPGVPHYRAWQPKATSTAAGGSWVRYRYQVLTPFAALLHKSSADDSVPADAIALWVAATGDLSCRAWMTLFTGDLSSDEARLREFQDRIFLQDLPILESQQPKALPLSGGEAMSAADRLSAAYRRYLRESGITVGVC